MYLDKPYKRTYTYNGPEVPVWWACPKWLAENNDRFLKGTIKG